MSTPQKPPRKKWRVLDRSDAGLRECTSEKAAFQEVARAVNAKGHEAWVYHWEHGRWQLFEKLPADTAWAAPAVVPHESAN